MGFVHYSEGFLFSNCHSPIALYFISLTNMRTRLSVLGKRRIKSELFMKSVYIAKQTRWNRSCSENVTVVCMTFFCLTKQPKGSLRSNQSENPWIYYQVGGREKGAVKRDRDFTFFTPRSREAVPELWWGPSFQRTPPPACHTLCRVQSNHSDPCCLLGSSAIA